MDFTPKVEGLQFHACDAIIVGLIASIESRIGPGLLAEDPVSSKLPAPPWWLIAASALALLAMFGDVQKAIFQ